MLLNVFESLLVVSELLLDPVVFVIMAEVTRVQHVVLDGIVVSCQGFEMVRPDEPSLFLGGLLILDVLEVVVCWQVAVVGCGYTVVYLLSAVLY